MPVLGVGGATPFHMKTNHPTALNHAFRDEVPYDPRIQTKMKCNYCGCWTTKGKPCYFCHLRGTTKPMLPPRDNSVSVVPAEARSRPVTARGMSPSTQQDARASSVRGNAAPQTEGNPASNTPRTARMTSPMRPLSADISSRLVLNGSQVKGGPTQYTNALIHKFRDESSYIPSQNTKIKCKSCGCWVTRGKPCSLCRAVTR
jgi:hypothetical protein